MSGEANTAAMAIGQKSAMPPRIFTPEYYARIHELEKNHGWYRGMREITLRLVDRYCHAHESMRILDAGCGTGGLLCALERFAKSSGVLIGLDLAPEALQFCRQRNSFGVVHSSVTPLPFAEASFDLITCSDVLQHVTEGDDQQTLEEFFRVLRPAGLLILRVAAGVGDPILSLRYYRVETIASQMRRAGFVVEKASYLNQLSYLVQAMRRKGDPGFRVEGLPQMPPSGLGGLLSPAWWKSKLIFYSLKHEADQLCRGDRTYRRGTSIVCVARKPVEGTC